MDLVGPNGEPLTMQNNPEDIKKILDSIRPKNKEQEAVLAQMVGERVERVRKSKMEKGLREGFNKTFQRNEKLKRDDTKGKDWRLIAAIPQEMAYVARQIWGDDVFTDPAKFNEAFVKDELGQYCLTVDPKKI